jgi:hypothetical protein
MIVVRPTAEFRADFPDDGIWGANGEIVLCGGKNVIEAIAAIMVSIGCSVGEAEEDGEHGWVCPFAYGKLSDNLRVCCGGFILFFEKSRRAESKDPLFYRLLLELNDRLRADGRFHDLSWYSEQRRGPDGTADVPVTGDVPSLEEASKKPGLLGKLLAPLRPRP